MSIENKSNELIVIKEFAGQSIRQRADGYLNATEMCKVGRKTWSNYIKNDTTKEYLDELESVLLIRRTKLVQSTQGGDPKKQGTWVHPRVAIHLAQWISPRFAVQVTDWVLRFMSGDLTLVAEVVERHDAIHGTSSQVLIETMSNQLEEYKDQIKKLETTSKNLSTDIEKLNEYRCKYCNRRYSSTNGLSNHINNKCEERQMQKYLRVVDYDKFSEYMLRVVSRWSRYESAYGFKLSLVDWDKEDKRISLKREKSKEYVYDIYNNSSRIKLMNVLNEKHTLPVDKLFDVNSLKIMQNNKSILRLVDDFNTYGSSLN